MPVQTATLFNPTQLTAGAVSLLTVPGTPATIILSGGVVRMTNTDVAGHAVTAYAVPSAGSPGVGNCFMNAEPIAPNTHQDVALPVLGAGGTYQFLADTTGVVTVSPLAGTLVS
jgi:hypothetical protein